MNFDIVVLLNNTLRWLSYIGWLLRLTNIGNWAIEFEINSTSDTKGKTNTTGNGNSLNIHSVTPQGQINKTDILKGTYASDTDGNENQTNTQGNDESHNTSKTWGHNKSQVMLLREYRENIIMINREIVADLADLFIGIY